MINLELRKFYQNKLGETFVVVDTVDSEDIGYAVGFRFWVVQIGDHNNVFPVTANGYQDVVCLEQQPGDLVQEVISQ